MINEEGRILISVFSLYHIISVFSLYQIKI